MIACATDFLPEVKNSYWSRYQEDIFAAVEDAENQRHLCIEACAGSGKTSTLIEAISRTKESSSALMVAFNKEIATTLKKKAPVGVDVSTLHSYGLRALREAFGQSPEIDNDKNFKLANKMLDGVWVTRGTKPAILKLVALAKATLADHDDPVALDCLLDDFSIDVATQERQRVVNCAARIIRRNLDDYSTIDFDDMIWLPVVLDMEVPQYDWVFSDESQDLSPSQLELTLAAVAPGGRIVAVGDRNQSIYGFRGADTQAIPNIIRRLKAATLPLSISYRCPRSVVREAQKYVPHIETAPGAPEGIVRHCDENELDPTPGDFIISRINAPLVSLAFSFLSRGVRCRIQGRDIGGGLISWVRNSKASTIAELKSKITSWEEKEIRRLEKDGRDTTAVVDKSECLRVLARHSSTVEDLSSRVHAMFADNGGKNDIILTSTHRAKGLEADRVWMLRDTFTEYDQQNRNICYVAITRAKKELIFVRQPQEE